MNGFRPSRATIWRFRHFTFVVDRSVAVLVCFLCLLHSTGAAFPPAVPPRPPWNDPQAMFDTLFGEEGEDDEKVLAEIEVSAREEYQIGKRAVGSYLAYLKQQRLRIVKRGRDIDYLRRLVGTLRPMMDHRERYPAISCYPFRSFFAVIRPR